MIKNSPLFLLIDLFPVDVMNFIFLAASSIFFNALRSLANIYLRTSYLPGTIIFLTPDIQKILPLRHYGTRHNI